MTTPIDWISIGKLSSEVGVSKSAILRLLDTGEIEFSKKGRSKQSGLLIRISSFNKYWEKHRVIKLKR